MSDLGDLDDSSLSRVIQLIHKLTGISMGANKKTLIQGRLRPRIKILGLKSYGEYLSHVEAHKEEVQEFINLVTTNETTFFRTQRVWDYFMKDYLTSWLEKNPKSTLKIWSGASSTGEEIYTIGVCCEEFRSKNPAFNYSIQGTDIDSQVLATAEKGIYTGRSIEAFKTNYKAMFDKWMEPVEGGVRVKSEIKQRIKFSLHNLFNLPSMKNHFDIVFLRNVLIYFEAKDQEKVLTNMSKGLVNQGVLIIGESESLNNLNVPFKFKQALVYEKTEGA